MENKGRFKLNKIQEENNISLTKKIEKMELNINSLMRDNIYLKGEIIKLKQKVHLQDDLTVPKIWAVLSTK